LTAARRLAVGALGGGSRQHPVLGGDPTPPAIAYPCGDALLDGRGAQHVGVAETGEARSFGVLVDIDL
jgi:hypothetical protein